MKGGIYMAFFIRFIACMLVVCICLGERQFVFADEDLNMYSGGYVLMDGDTGRVLAGKEEKTPMANASTTKILTCIVTLENCQLEEEVTVSKNAANQPRVRLGIKEGEIYQLKELIYGLMLESYNDCAVAIAEHVSGSVEEFAKAMNEKAKEIGCTDTYFITPNGLDAEDETSFHHTTAEDLCRIMAYCTWESPASEKFLEITQTRNYGEFVNRNSFLNQMEGVLTGKTGFTNKAGYCYVAALERNGERYCIALLACGWPNNKNYKWKDAKTLFEYAIENYDKKNVLVKEYKNNIIVNGIVSKPQFENLNKEGSLCINASERIYKILIKEGENIEVKTEIYPLRKYPIQEGMQMGECKVYVEDTLVDVYPIVANENVYMWEWKEIFNTIFYQFLTFS